MSEPDGQRDEHHWGPPVHQRPPGDTIGPVTLPLPLAILKSTIQRATGNGGLDRAATMAYYAMQAIFPTILVVVLISLAMTTTSTITDAVEQAEDQGLSPQIASAIDEILTTAVERAGSSGTIIATIVSGLLAVVSASGLMAATGRAIVPAQEERRQRNVIAGKLYFAGWTLLLLVLGVVSLSALTIGGDLADEIAQALGRDQGAPVLWSVIRPLLVIGGLIALMLLLFRVAPDPVRPKPIRRLLPGALFAGIGLVVGTIGFSFYLSQLGSIGATYGAFATPIVLLLWMYYSSAIVLVGAELNHELADRTGKFRSPLRLAGAGDDDVAGHPLGAMPTASDDD